MQISMWMLAERLSARVVSRDIAWGRPMISFIRYLPAGGKPARADTAYVSESGEEGLYRLTNGSDLVVFSGGGIAEALDCVLEAADFYFNWEKELQKAARGGCTMQAILDLCEPVIRSPMFINAPSGAILGITKSYRDAPVDNNWPGMAEDMVLPVGSTFVPLLLTDGTCAADFTEYPQLFEKIGEGATRYIGLYVYIDNNPAAGFCILEYAKPLAALEMQLAAVAAQYILLAIESSPDVSAYLSGASLFKELIDKESPPEETARLLFSAFGGDELLNVFVVQNNMRMDSLQRRIVMRAIRRQCAGSVTADLGHLVAAVVPASELDGELEMFKREMTMNPYKIGISLPFYKNGGLFVHFRQACFALECDRAKAGVFYCRDYAYAYMLRLLQNDEAAPGLVHPALTILREYDTRNGTALYGTLKRYLECERNLVETAKGLFIHRNTLVYRLSRIGGLIGEILDDPAERMYLRLSYAIEDKPG